MRINQIKPDTQYATCDGQLLVTGPSTEMVYGMRLMPLVTGVEVISHIRGQVGDALPKEYRGTRSGAIDVILSQAEYAKIIGKQDPWGGCAGSGSTINLVYKGKWYRVATSGYRSYKSVIKKGLRVTDHGYDLDVDGRPLGEGVVRFAESREIVGTWTEYLVLHGERMKEKVARAKRDEALVAIEQRAKEGGVNHIRFTWGTGSYNEAPTNVYLDLDGAAALAYLASLGIDVNLADYKV